MESKFGKLSHILKKYIVRILVLFFIIGLIQTITFSVFGERRLKNKLLPSYFILPNKSDSIYVRGYPIMDDNVSKTSFITFDLKKLEDKIKKSFKVEYVFFQDKQHINANIVESHYKLLYYAWVEKRNRWPLFDFYKVRLTEYLNNRDQELLKEVEYQWILFFWFKKTELIQSWEIKLDGHKTLQ
jgi:hypothetical protein